MQRVPDTYRPDVDGLRAVAVTSVLLFHAGYQGFSGGFVGVDVFFVISGYVITRTILRDIREARFSFQEFYARRVRRIFPALLLVIVVTLVAGWFLLVPEKYEVLAREAVAGALFVPNLLFWNEAGYFDKAAESKPLLHLWSLGIEEQFYLVWPAAVLLFARRERALIGFFFIVAITSFAFCIYLTAVDHVAAFYLPLSRVWELSLGGIASVLRWEPASPKVRSWLLMAGLAAIGAAVLRLAPGPKFPGAWAAIPTLGAAIVIWSGRNNTSLPGRLLASKPVAYVGLISYPLYLWHWPLIVVARPSIPVFGLLALSVILAILSYELFEKKLRKARPRMVARPLLAGMVVATVVSFAIVAAEGVYSRYPPEVASILRKYDYGEDARLYTCWLVDERGPQSYAPECTAPTLDGGILIVGDSHAARLYPGLRNTLANAAIWQITRSACSPSWGNSSPCGRTWDYALEIAKRQRPRLVILFASWLFYAIDWHENTAIAASLGSIIDRFVSTGAKVIVLGPAPVWKQPVPDIAYGEWRRTGHVPDRLNDVDPTVGVVDQQIRSIAQSHGARFVSVSDLLCDDVGCLVHPPGDPARLMSWDTGHLTTAGAEFLAPLLGLK